MNFASIKVVFTERPAVRVGKTGKPYCQLRAAMISKDRNGEIIRCEVRGLVAFGDVAERLANVDANGQFKLECELGGSPGRGEFSDRVFMEWIVREVSQVITGEERQAAAPSRQEPGPALEPSDDSLPF